MPAEWRGECPVCKSGDTGHCPNGALFGSDPAWGNLNGGMAEYVRVPFADQSCILIPEGVPDEHALYPDSMIFEGFADATSTVPAPPAPATSVCGC